MRSRILSSVLKGTTPFKAQAYERGATAVLTSQPDLADLIATNSLTDLSDIGPATARGDVVNTRSLPAMKSLLRQARPYRK